MKLLRELNEQDELPTSSEVLSDIEEMLRAVAARSAKYETKDSSRPAGPDTSKFRASQSGKVEFAKNMTTHGYGGSQIRYHFGLKVGSAIGYENGKKVRDEVTEYFEDISDDYGFEGKAIKTSDGKHISLRNSDGSNYDTIGVSVT